MTEPGKVPIVCFGESPSLLPETRAMSSPPWFQAIESACIIGSRVTSPSTGATFTARTCVVSLVFVVSVSPKQKGYIPACESTGHHAQIVSAASSAH